MLLPHNNAETIEVNTDNVNKTQYYFSDSATRNLRNKMIRRILCLRNDSGAAVSPSGKSVVSTTIFDKATLVLVSNSAEIINRASLFDFFAATSNYGNVLKINAIIDWSKSYVEIANSTGLNAAETFVFTVFYDEKEIPKVYTGPIALENIEVITNSVTEKKFLFPDDSRFVGRKVRHIVFSAQQYSRTGKTNYGYSGSFDDKHYLVLNIAGKERFYNVPLVNFKNVNQSFENFIELNGFVVDWAKSYVLVGTTSNLNVSYSWTFNILMEK